MGTFVNPADSLEEREKLLKVVASIKKLAECLEMTRTASELGKTLNDPDRLQNTDIRKQLDALAGFCGFLWSMCRGTSNTSCSYWIKPLGRLIMLRSAATTLLT